MPWLTNLDDVARRTGFPVVEVRGWKTRGRESQYRVDGIVCHHTAGPAGNGDYPSLAVVRDGRAGLPGPLSHFGLGRSGTIYVIAAGRCNHNAPSTSTYHTNSRSLGIEAENNGRQQWPSVQLQSYKRLCAELCKEFDLHPTRVKGHKEVNTSKPDPHSVNMNAFRSDVADIMEGADLPLNSTDLAKVRAIVEKAILDMWAEDKCPAPWPQDGNPYWQFRNVLRTAAQSYKRIDDVEMKLDVISSRMDAVIALLTQSPCEKSGEE